MNFFRSRLSIGCFTVFSSAGQRCRPITQTWNHRGMCNKIQESKTEPPPSAASAHANRSGFKIPGYKPSNLDKKILIWSGRFKTVDQIPEFVSFEMIDSARNKVRVKACYAMIIATIGGCVLMIFLGKTAAGRHESVTGLNMKKKALWDQELQRQKAAVDVVSEKTQ